MMVEMGYYNYYNIESRYNVSKPHDRYQEMVNRYKENSDTLHSNNEDPYSDKNIAIRNFEEKLAVVAADNRSKCATAHDVYAYLGKKYFGKDGTTYMDRLNADESTRAMYDNELRATLFGTYQASNTADPRIKWQEEDWATEEAKTKNSNQKIISNQMNNLLTKNGISLEAGDTLLISFNPYDYTSSVSGLKDSDALNKINTLLNSGKNSKELFYYTFKNSGSLNAEAVTKYRAYQNLLDLTGIKLSDCTLENGRFYTSDGTDVISLIEKGIEKDSLIPNDFKNVANQYTKDMLQEVAKKGFNSMPDLNLTIGYNTNYGFFSTSNIMYEA